MWGVRLLPWSKWNGQDVSQVLPSPACYCLWSTPQEWALTNRGPYSSCRRAGFIQGNKLFRVVCLPGESGAQLRLLMSGWGWSHIHWGDVSCSAGYFGGRGGWGAAEAIIWAVWNCCLLSLSEVWTRDSEQGLLTHRALSLFTTEAVMGRAGSTDN